MQYIRTTDGIFRYKRMTAEEFEFYTGSGSIELINKQVQEIKVADNFEDLIQVGDLVEISGYVAEVAVVYEKDEVDSLHLGVATLKDPDNIRIYSYEVQYIRKLYIPEGAGYKLAAIHHIPQFDTLEEIEEKGEWELVY